MFGKGDVRNKVERVRLGQDHRSPRSQLGRINLDSGGTKGPWKGLAVVWPSLQFRKTVVGNRLEEQRQRQQPSHCCKVLGTRWTDLKAWQRKVSTLFWSTFSIFFLICCIKRNSLGITGPKVLYLCNKVEKTTSLLFSPQRGLQGT